MLSAVTDWVLLLPLPDGFFLSVNTMIKIELLFSLCCFYSFLWAIYRMGAQRSGGVSNRAGRIQHNGWIWLWMVDRCSVWPEKNSCVGVLENALPLGNNTTTHIFLMSPTHMCTFLCVIPANRIWLFLEELIFITQITQEWAHLVINTSHGNTLCPCGVSADKTAFSPQFLSWLSMSRHGKGATVTDRPGWGCCSVKCAVGLSW